MLGEDYPIIYANEAFELMTLYSKEEVMGKNCRFLQGNLTNPETVVRIKNGIQNGEDLSVSILNYRKDGIPFWNSFRLLPIHADRSEPKLISHYMAIQQDVTIIQQTKRETATWNSTEVAMWLETVCLGEYAQMFISQEIDGKSLLLLEKEDLITLGISEDHIKFFMVQLRKIKKCEETTEIEPLLPRTVTVRAFYSTPPRRKVKLFKLRENDTLDVLRKRLEHFFPDFQFNINVMKSHKLKPLETNAQLVEAILKTDFTRPLQLYLEKVLQPISAEKLVFLKDLLYGIVIFDSEWDLLYINPQIEEMAGYSNQDLFDKPLEVIIPLKKLSIGFQSSFLLTRNGIKVPIQLGISQTKDNLFLGTIQRKKKNKKDDIESCDDSCSMD